MQQWQKYAAEALSGLDGDALARPALRSLRRGTPAERVLAASLLARWGDVDAVRPLIYAAIRDREKDVRSDGGYTSVDGQVHTDEIWARVAVGSVPAA